VDAGASCEPGAQPWRNYVSTSPDQCQLIDFYCEVGTTGFTDWCGCGCEQPSWCPEWVNCMPGAVPAFVPPPDGDPGGIPAPPQPDPCYDETICPFSGRAY
jgi:hypothetical protein